MYMTQLFMFIFVCMFVSTYVLFFMKENNIWFNCIYIDW